MKELRDIYNEVSEKLNENKALALGAPLLAQLPDRLSWLDAYWEAKLSNRWFWPWFYRFFGRIQQNEIKDYITYTLNRLKTAEFNTQPFQPGETAILSTISQGKIGALGPYLSTPLLAVYKAFQQVNFFPQNWYSMLEHAKNYFTKWLYNHPVPNNIAIKKEMFKEKEDRGEIEYMVIGEVRVHLTRLDKDIETYKALDTQGAKDKFKKGCSYDFDRFMKARNNILAVDKLERANVLQNASVSALKNLPEEEKDDLAESIFYDFQLRAYENESVLSELDISLKNPGEYSEFVNAKKSACTILYYLVNYDTEDGKPIQEINQMIGQFCASMKTKLENKNAPLSIWFQKLYDDFDQAYLKIAKDVYNLRKMDETKSEADKSPVTASPSVSPMGPLYAYEAAQQQAPVGSKSRPASPKPSSSDDVTDSSSYTSNSSSYKSFSDLIF